MYGPGYRHKETDSVHNTRAISSAYGFSEPSYSPTAGLLHGSILAISFLPRQLAFSLHSPRGQYASALWLLTASSLLFFSFLFVSFILFCRIFFGTIQEYKVPHFQGSHARHANLLWPVYFATHPGSARRSLFYSPCLHLCPQRQKKAIVLGTTRALFLASLEPGQVFTVIEFLFREHQPIPFTRL